MAQILHSCIIRIIRYKADIQNKGFQMDGILEDAESVTRQPFHNAEELWSLIHNSVTRSNSGDEK